MEKFKYSAIVIEPSLSERLVLKEKLFGAGISVVAFDGISEALEHLSSSDEAPQLLFVSAHFGRMSLEELMFFVRADADLKGVEVILMARHKAALEKVGDIDVASVLFQPLQEGDLVALLARYK